MLSHFKIISFVNPKEKLSLQGLNPQVYEVETFKFSKTHHYRSQTLS